MSENSQNDSSTNNDSNSEYYDRRAARRQRIEERRAGRSGSWVVGAILILVGVDHAAEPDLVRPGKLVGAVHPDPGSGCFWECLESLSKG